MDFNLSNHEDELDLSKPGDTEQLNPGVDFIPEILEMDSI